MNNLRRLISAVLVALLTGVVPVLAAPTHFDSTNYTVESVIFGGTGTLRSSSASIPPVITLGPTVSNITTTSAIVQWTTDKLTSGLVFVGTTSGNYTLQAGDSVTATLTAHSVDLTFLKKNTQYFYKVRSVDIAGNAVESAEFTFTSDTGDITAPVITSGPTIAQNSANQVTVTWTTDEVSNSIVEYGVQNVSENSVGRTDELTLFHQITLSVQASQNYRVRVKSKDASDNTVTSGIITLETISSPAITDVRITDITLNSALVQWKTSVPSTSVVSFGTESSKYTEKAEDLTLTENHLVRLDNLVNGTIFYLRITGTDGSGGKLTSDEYVFRTVILPTIRDFKINEIGSNGAQMSWVSSSDIDQFVRYEIINAPDPTLNGKRSATGDDKLVTQHAAQLTDLESGTEYSVTVSGKDIFGNQAISPTLTFTTLPDNDPPLIENLRSDTTVDLGSRQTVQVLVSFGLSEPGIAKLEYGEGATDIYTKTVETDTDMTRNKFLVIPGLKPGESYHFRVRAVDRAGNEAISPDYLVLAPAQPVSLLDLIFGQIRANFGWLQNIGK